jgi:hypothetical protein
VSNKYTNHLPNGAPKLLYMVILVKVYILCNVFVCVVLDPHHKHLTPILEDTPYTRERYLLVKCTTVHLTLTGPHSQTQPTTTTSTHFRHLPLELTLPDISLHIWQMPLSSRHVAVVRTCTLLCLVCTSKSTHWAKTAVLHGIFLF